MMKGSMIVCLFFLLGCLIGFGAHIQLDTHNLSMYILYVLMFQVGINIGSNENLKGMLAHFTPKMLIIPLGTMAVGSGFAYYSLSSILITQFKEPSLGLQLATELGTIALLTNIFREMMALLGTPLIRKCFGRFAPISAAGVNSMDVLLPSILRYSGKDMMPIAILHGVLIDLSVPVFVSFFCSL